MASKTNHIFIDTSWFKAIVDRNDKFHSQAVSAFTTHIKKNQLELVTSNYILDESFTLIRVKRGLSMALTLKEKLLALDTKLKIVRVGEQDDLKAWNWFIKNWSGLSFTDCTSFAIMKRLGLNLVATFDNHFSRAGFKVI